LREAGNILRIVVSVAIAIAIAIAACWTTITVQSFRLPPPSFRHPPARDDGEDSDGSGDGDDGEERR